MTEHADEILDVLTADSDPNERLDELEAHLAELAPADLAGAVADLGETLGPYGFGYVVFPALGDRVGDEAVFDALWERVADPEADDGFRLVALDALDGAARRDREGLGSDHWARLRALAGDGGHADPARATAARLLVRSPGEETAEVLAGLLAEESPTLAGAAARVVAAWTGVDRGIPGDLAERVVDRAAEDGPAATGLLAGLGGLADAGHDEAAAVLDRFAAAAAEPVERVRLLDAAGGALAADRFADLVAAVRESATGPEQWALRGLLAAHPDRYADLRAAGRTREYVDALSVRADGDAQTARHLAAIAEERGDELAARAAALTRHPGYRGHLDDLPERPLAEAVATDGGSDGWIPIEWPPFDWPPSWWGPVVTDRQRVRSGYTSGMRQGDGLYRELDFQFATSLGVLGDHWHSALLLGLYRPGNGPAELRRIEAGKPVFDCIGIDAVSGSLGGPGDSLAAAVGSLVDDFEDDWTDNGRLDYHGARTTGPGRGWMLRPLAGYVREDVAANARSLHNRGIRYTFEDQLDYNWWSWNGQPSDVDEIRCDGIIEYSYEREGVRVCDGADSTEWNVSKSGIRYPENHNDFHNNRWNPGEICPRVQGGGEGSDTEFTEADPDPPTIETFDVEVGSELPIFGSRPDHPPRFSVEVGSETSSEALVRIAVAPEGGTFHFLRGHVGFGWHSTWDYRTVSTGSTYTVEWLGATSGPDFGGDDDNYDVRVVAVDRGGNVSDEYERTVEVYWP